MAFIPNHERDLLFLDSETTGLDPNYNEAIEWAAIRVGPDGVEKEAFEAKVKPRWPERFDTRAREVNGYTEEAWADAPDEAETAKKMIAICRDVILVGQNIKFDIDFLVACLKRHELKPSWHYHSIDTMNLAWPGVKSQVIKGMSLVNICEWAGIQQPTPHRAMTDARCVQQVYNTLMARWNAVTF